MESIVIVALISFLSNQIKYLKYCVKDSILVNENLPHFWIECRCDTKQLQMRLRHSAQKCDTFNDEGHVSDLSRAVYLV